MSFAAVAVGIVAALATHSACERIELNIDFFRFFPRSFNEYIFSRIYVEHSDFPAEICFWSSYRKKWSGIISESASEEFLEYVQDVKQLHGALEDLENILIEQL